MEYCNETYPQLLDDYIHIMINHQHDIEQVLKSNIDLCLMNECNINNCIGISRHFRDRQNEITITPSSSSWKCQECSLMNKSTNSQCQACFELACDLSFYIDLLDSIHCHWFHSYDLGLRVKMDDIIKQTDDEKGDHDEFYYDSQFSKRNKVIQQRLKQVNHIKGLQNRLNNKKYSLSMTETKVNAQGI